MRKNEIKLNLISQLTFHISQKTNYVRASRFLINPQMSFPMISNFSINCLHSFSPRKSNSLLNNIKVSSSDK